METKTNFADRSSEQSGSRRTRRKRRRRLVLGLGPRLALAGTAIALTLFALVEFGLKIAQPYQMQRVEARQIDDLRARLTSDGTANCDLGNKIAYLRRPDGIENAARAQDWVKRGEIPLDITVVPPPKSRESSGFSGMIQRAWRNLTKRQ